MEPFTVVEVAQGAGVFFAVLGTVVYALKKNGKITFGNGKERRSSVEVCPVHDSLIVTMESNKEQLKDSIELNRAAIEKADLRIDGLAKDVGVAVGFIKAKTGNSL